MTATVTPIRPVSPQATPAGKAAAYLLGLGYTPASLRYFGFTALADALERLSPLEAAMTAAGVTAVLEASTP